MYYILRFLFKSILFFLLYRGAIKKVFLLDPKFFNGKRDAYNWHPFSYHISKVADPLSFLIVFFGFGYQCFS
jgi:hypothetical protein